jgi:hypothetical protein
LGENSNQHSARVPESISLSGKGPRSKPPMIPADQSASLNLPIVCVEIGLNPVSALAVQRGGDVVFHSRWRRPRALSKHLEHNSNRAPGCLAAPGPGPGLRTKSGFGTDDFSLERAPRELKRSAGGQVVLATNRAHFCPGCLWWGLLAQQSLGNVLCVCKPRIPPGEFRRNERWTGSH